MAFKGGGRHQCQSFLAGALKHLLPPVDISSPRSVVHVLPRGPDDTGCEDRWGILSQSQIPDTTGVFVLSELLPHTS